MRGKRIVSLFVLVFFVFSILGVNFSTVGYAALDPNKPNLMINNGAYVTDSLVVTLNINYDDGTYGGMKISNTTNVTNVTEYTAQNQFSWQLTSGAGQKTVYIKFIDHRGWPLGNYVSDTYNASIYLADPMATPIIDTAENVSVNQNINVKFEDNIQPNINDNLNLDNIQLQQAGALVPSSKTISGNILTIIPQSPLANSTKYTISIPEHTFINASVTKVSKAATLSFITAAAAAVSTENTNTSATVTTPTDTTQTPTAVVQKIGYVTNPLAYAQNVPVDQQVIIDFDEAIINNDEGACNGIVITDVPQDKLVKSVDGKRLTISHPSLGNDKAYNVIIPQGAFKNSSGNKLSPAINFNFTTVKDSSKEESGVLKIIQEKIDKISQAMGKVKTALINEFTDYVKLALKLPLISQTVKDKIRDKLIEVLSNNINQTDDITIKPSGDEAVVTNEQINEKITELEKKIEEYEKKLKELSPNTKLEQATDSKVISIKIEKDTQNQNSNGNIQDQTNVSVPIDAFDSLESKNIQAISLDFGKVKIQVPTEIKNQEQIKIKSQKEENASVEFGTKILSSNAAQQVLNGISPDMKVIKDVPVMQFSASVMGAKDKDKTSIDTNLGDGLEIQVPLTGAELSNLDPNQLVAMLYVQDSKHLDNEKDTKKLNTWQPVGGKYDAATNTFKFKRKMFSMYTIMQINRNFDDITKFKWAQNEIRMMAAKGFVTGKSANKFDPEANVSRAEFVSMVVRTLGLMDKTARVNFNDVKKTDWYYTALASAYSQHIISGDYRNNFRPNEAINRLEMMGIISNLLQNVLGVDALSKDEVSKILNSFVDKNSIPSWASNAISLNVHEGIVKGNPLKMIYPKGKTSRAEAAVIVKRIYDMM
jgi:hypothetical protein